MRSPGETADAIKKEALAFYRFRQENPCFNITCPEISLPSAEALEKQCEAVQEVVDLICSTRRNPADSSSENHNAHISDESRCGRENAVAVLSIDNNEFTPTVTRLRTRPRPYKGDDTSNLLGNWGYIAFSDGPGYGMQMAQAMLATRKFPDNIDKVICVFDDEELRNILDNGGVVNLYSQTADPLCPALFPPNSVTPCSEDRQLDGYRRANGLIINFIADNQEKIDNLLLHVLAGDQVRFVMNAVEGLCNKRIIGFTAVPIYTALCGGDNNAVPFADGGTGSQSAIPSIDIVSAVFRPEAAVSEGSQASMPRLSAVFPVSGETCNKAIKAFEEKIREVDGVIRIWKTVLDNFGLSFSGKEVDEKNIFFLARLLGIDGALEAYRSGVALEDLHLPPNG